MKSQLELEKERDELVTRLDKGAALIEQDRAKGKETSRLETLWLKLLHQYETICDQLRSLRMAGFDGSDRQENF